MTREGVEAVSGWPAGGGEMGERIRAFDWSATPLGPFDQWPRSLRTAVDLMLGAAQPVYIGWGSELISLFNDSYIPILGDKHPGGLGKPYAELWAEIWEDFRPVVAAVRAGEGQYFVDQPLALKGRPGRPMSWFTYSWAPLRDDTGAVAGFYCAAVETTERVLAEQAERHRTNEALRTSEEKYRTLFESIDSGFCIIEVLFNDSGEPGDYRFLETNPAFEKQTGLTDATGKRMRELAPEHESHWFEIYGEIALTGVPRRFQDPAEALGRFYDVYAFRIGDPEAHHVAVLFNDIAERKRAEEALREREAQLQQANRAKDEFLAMLGHELRNPLAPIMSHLQLMHLREPDSLVRDREIIEKQVRHLAGLVDDLLDVSRIARGKIKLEKAPVDMAGVVTQGIETVSPLFEENDQIIEKSLDTDLMVEGDARRLVQVVTNLLSNAIKYSPPRGLITISTSAEDGSAVLRVGDQGAGIDAKLMPRIFDLFAQSTQSIDRAGGGLGLGLAIVHNLVALHGGSVEARSEGRDCGSEFIVRLPLLEYRPIDEEVVSAPAVEDRAAGRPRVLVVDDYADAAAAIAELLELEGYETCIAHDGAAALKAASEFEPAVALIDIGLPVMNGYEVARRLRETPGLESTALIAVTGYGQESDRRAACEAGFDMHVVKPLDPGALGELIDRHAPAVKTE